MKKYAMPVIMLVIFETVAITLWLTKDNLFYLFNFSYIGLSISLGTFLFIRKYKYARKDRATTGRTLYAYISWSDQP